MTSFAQRLGPSQLQVGRRTTGTATASFDRKRASAVSAQATPRIGFDFARIPLHAPAEAGVQANLEVGSAADTHEQEADRVAKEVMRMPEPQAGCACAYGGRARSARLRTRNQDSDLYRPVKLLLRPRSEKFYAPPGKLSIRPHAPSWNLALGMTSAACECMPMRLRPRQPAA